MRDKNIRRNEQLRERLATLESRQSVFTPATSADPTTDRQTEASALTTILGASRRLRPRLPDPALFEGQKSMWRGWKLEMEGTLIEDAEALRDKLSQLRYVYSRLSGRAKENVTTFVETSTR